MLTASARPERGRTSRGSAEVPIARVVTLLLDPPTAGRLTPTTCPGTALDRGISAANVADTQPARAAMPAESASAPGRPSRRVAPRWAVEALFGALLMAAFHLFVVQISVVKGHSMEPSLQDGDRLVVDRTSPEVGELARGDVVILRYPRNPSVDFVKRVVGLPGDRVALKNGQLWVNGTMAEDLWTCIADLDTTKEVVVPEGCCFVLGDNRPVSCDSREFGLVPEGLLRGRVRARFWPLDRFSVF